MRKEVFVGACRRIIRLALCVAAATLLTGASGSPLTAPKIDGRTDTSLTAAVSWTLSSSVARLKPNLRIFRSVDGGAFTLIAELEKVKRKGTYTDTVPADGSYRYRASVKKGSKKSKASNVVTVSVTTGGGTPPPPPPPPGTGSFDANGNVTDAGKVLFGIPSNLSANKFTGKTIVDANCSCHGEKTNRVFSVVKSRIKAPPMSFSFSDAEVANIVAYLNRFR